MALRNTLPRWAIDALEEIDAGVFTGDTFINKADLRELEWFVNRWSKEVELRKEVMRIAEEMLEG